MYPGQLFNLFPPFPRNDRVFVAMSFDGRFDHRWRSVIESGIQAAGLEPFRVDARKVGDSILTEILVGISNSRLVFVDLSTLDGFRNGNVMYEIGLAHAVRQPQEVLLFRSDDDRLLFDITQVRVNRYHPDEDPDAARQQLTATINEAIREIDLTKSLSVQRVVSSLSYWEIETLLSFAQHTELQVPITRTLVDVMAQINRSPAITRLLELGLIETAYPNLIPAAATYPKEKPLSGLFAFRMTQFGKAALEKIVMQMAGIRSRQDIQGMQEIQRLLQRLAESLTADASKADEPLKPAGS
jgi:hypothetical protein